MTAEVSIAAPEAPGEPKTSASRTVHYGHCQRFIKGEDILFCHPEGEGLGQHYGIFGLVDGHQGDGCAQYVADNFAQTIHPLMLDSPYHLAEDPAFYAQRIRAALRESFVKLDKYLQANCVDESGCTCTVAILTGDLMTVANVGDSQAIIVLPAGMDDMTYEHRVQESASERERLVRGGSHLASISLTMVGPAEEGDPGLGPLRVWPGGLCVSRALGDADVGALILAEPHIKQVEVPPDVTARLCIASDGLWDLLSKDNAAKLARQRSLMDLPAKMIAKAMRANQGLLRDDTSVLVVDLVPPPPTPSTEGSAGDVPAPSIGVPPPSKGGLMCCFSPPRTAHDGPPGKAKDPSNTRRWGSAPSPSGWSFRGAAAVAVDTQLVWIADEDTHVSGLTLAQVMAVRGAPPGGKPPRGEAALVSPPLDLQQLSCDLIRRRPAAEPVGSAPIDIKAPGQPRSQPQSVVGPVDSAQEVEGLEMRTSASQPSLAAKLADLERRASAEPGQPHPPRAHMPGERPAAPRSEQGRSSTKLHRYPSADMAEILSSSAVSGYHVAASHDLHTQGSHTVHAGCVYPKALKEGSELHPRAPDLPESP